MSGIFLKLLNLSISASWLVLVVLALRLVLKRAPKWVNVLLWGMVALRLMLPFSIESALSLIPSAETLSPEVVQFDPAPTITSGVTIIDNAVNPSLSESFAAAPLASVNPPGRVSERRTLPLLGLGRVCSRCWLWASKISQN